MNGYCEHIQEHFSGYLDGAISGSEMQAVAAHLEGCGECAAEFQSLRTMQQTLASMGATKAPADLGLRLRVAVSQEGARTSARMLDRWQMRWQNTVGPFLLQASAGLASAVVLLGTVALLVGVVATPEPLVANDEPLGTFTGPHYLYSAVKMDSIGSTLDAPVVVEAYINGGGRVYDYRIVSGPTDLKTRDELESLLLYSVYEPARVLGQPVRGRVILSFAGISVRG